MQNQYAPFDSFGAQFSRRERISRLSRKTFSFSLASSHEKKILPIFILSQHSNGQVKCCEILFRNIFNRQNLLMKIKNIKRAIKKVKKFFRIERFLCYFDIEASVSLVSVFTAIPCCILSYHDAAFLWNYMNERSEEETRSGMRSLDGEREGRKVCTKMKKYF